MKLQLRVLNLWRIFFLPELHNDLHYMPVVVWWKIQKSGNPIDLIKGTKTASTKIINLVAAQWDKLNDDFTDFFKVQKRQKRYLTLLAEHQVCVSAFTRTQNHIWTTRRIYVELELEQYKPKEVKQFNEYEELRNVSMTLSGAHMNPQEMSVIHYYSDRDLAIKINKKAKQDQSKNKK